MTRGVVAIAGALGLLAGCHPTEALPPPPLGAAASALLIHMVDGAPAFVVALDPAQPTLPTFARAQDSTLYLVSFGCGLDALDLAAGPVSLRATAPELRVLPVPSAVHVLPLRDTVGAWAEGELPQEVQDVLSRVEVPTDSVCRRIQATWVAKRRSVQLATVDWVRSRATVPLGNDAFLVGVTFHVDITATTTTGYDALRIQGDSAEQLPELNAWGPLLGGLARSDGQLWLATREQLLLGHPDVGFQVVTSTVIDPLPDGLILLGAPDGSELYMATETALLGGIFPNFPAVRTLYRLEGDHWVRVVRRELPDAQQDRLSVAWVGPGHVVAAGFSGDLRVLRLRDGQVTDEAFGGTRANKVENVTDRGLMVADNAGGIYLDGAAGWTAIREKGEATVAYMRAVGADGLAVFGGYPTLVVGQVLPEVGACPAVSLDIVNPRRLVPSGPTGIFVLSADEGNLPYAYLSLERPPQRECLR